MSIAFFQGESTIEKFYLNGQTIWFYPESEKLLEPVYTP